MAEFLINFDDVETLIRSYSKIDDSFCVRSYHGDDVKKTCVFYLNGKECTVVIYFKKDGKIKMLHSGKQNTIEEVNKLIDFIEKKGHSTSVETNQFVIHCSQSIVVRLISYIQEECEGIVQCFQNKDIYKFTGYNGDTITFTFYPSTNKAMIQGRPFVAYSIITTFLAGQPEYSADDILAINNNFSGTNTPESVIRLEMQDKLQDAYSYLDEALKKSISGSLSTFKQTKSSEDYTGCITGVFKALEGYLTKVLTQKYNYRIKKPKFSMFFKEPPNRRSQIDLDNKISEKCKEELNGLYSLYSNKRNPYLHATIDPSQTRIIENIKDAQAISDEILLKIQTSYKIFFL